MNRGSIYVSIEDMMKLTGGSRSHAYDLHKTIRESLTTRKLMTRGRVKANLSILEYCEYTGDSFREVYFFLRGKYPAYDTGKN
ncbi:MAG: hypothetical protein AAGN35_15260 [Bacteroidota bacterium]